MRKNVFVSENTGYVIGGTDCDNMNKNFAVILEKRCQFSESLCGSCVDFMVIED
jgi:hypothetical protein